MRRVTVSTLVALGATSIAPAIYAQTEAAEPEAKAPDAAVEAAVGDDATPEPPAATPEATPEEPKSAPAKNKVRPGAAGDAHPAHHGGGHAMDAATESREPSAHERARQTPPPSGGNAVTLGKSFQISLDGYVRAEYTSFSPNRLVGVRMGATEESRNNPYVGRSDGFGLGGARLNLRGTYKDNLYVRLGFDGALVTYEDDQDVSGQLGTGLKDAYFRYTFAPELQVAAGRFKPPYDVEELTPTEDQFFVYRSVESRGVKRHEGFSGDMPGFAPGRQLGVMIGSPRLVESDDFGLGYAIALTNGAGNDAALNDNDLPALWVRLAANIPMGGGTDTEVSARKSDEEGPATYGIPDGVKIGLSFGANQLTTGNPPSRQRERVMSAGVDVAARAGIAVFQGQMLANRTTFLDVDADAQLAYGAHAQLAIEIPDTGLAPGYRFGIYDPRVVDTESPAILDDDRVMHHSLGLRWSPESLPLVTLLDYTNAIEQEGRTVPNHRVQVAMQVTFE